MLIDWTQINHVFLDMDGTLLDLHFDNHFWLEHVPLRYAEKHGLPIAIAKAELFSRYHAIAGTLNWYCVDHWSRELDMDIMQLKKEVAHFIAVHPHVTDFLSTLAETNLRCVLVTNAHQKSLALKLERTALAGYFDRIVSAHAVGIAKETPTFWSALQKIEYFHPNHTLLIDDNLNVLKSAQTFGLRWLIAIAKPDSTAPGRCTAPFLAINDFSTLVPLPYGVH
jgi:HAD superfamily hydrolase (TIGR01509 family)